MQPEMNTVWETEALEPLPGSAAGLPGNGEMGEPGGISPAAMPETITVIDLFEAQVVNRPEQTAIQHAGQVVSYDRLNRAANRVAHALLDQLGTGSEPIALYLEEGAETIIALVGVLKAGKFYVPLEAHGPQARAAAILADSQARLVIAHERTYEAAVALCATIAQEHRPQVLNLSRLDVMSLVEGQHDTNPGLLVTPDHNIALMYTSGSTGQPKGVIQTHRNLLKMIQLQDPSKTIAGDRIGIIAPLTFSGSIPDIMGALCNGASIHPYEMRRLGIPKLAAWLLEEEITVYHSVPTIFRLMVKMVPPDQKFRSIRVVKLGGEPIVRHDLYLFRQYFSDQCILRVSFGTTETYRIADMIIDQSTTEDWAVVPVGYPVAGKEVLLLDEQRRPVGAGEIGEIAVRSRYISPGYWRLPEQTAAAFLPDPAGGDQRIYLTGDLGRFLPNGCLEHLGRKDYQVKIHGNRVEPAEVETALMEYGGIRQTAVTAHKLGATDHRLAAYLVLEKDAHLDVNALRVYLHAKLPSYMVPAAFVFMDTLPILPAGKIDRNKLPAPDWKRPELSTDYVAPRTPVEDALARIWAEALGIDRVGVQDRFIELGGSSLQASQIIARVIQAFQITLAVQMLFNAETVAQMALIVTKACMEKMDSDLLEQLLSEIDESRT